MQAGDYVAAIVCLPQAYQAEARENTRSREWIPAPLRLVLTAVEMDADGQSVRLYHGTNSGQIDRGVYVELKWEDGRWVVWGYAGTPMAWMRPNPIGLRLRF